jgi:hypothetical protein
MRSLPVVVPSVFSLLMSLPLAGQEVISAYSGTVHFFEGAVLVDDRPLEHKAATFPSINEGSTLRTEKGRAEVLLTPNVFLRLDENSAIRMVSHALTDTQIEFLRGSAIVDSTEAAGAPPIVLIYQHYRVRFSKPGIYRIDSDTGVLQAYSGQAEVAGPEGKSAPVGTAKLYFFDLGALTNKFGEPNEDEFYDWAHGRADAIAAENQLAEQGNSDAADPDAGLSAGVYNAPLPSYNTFPAYPSLGPYGFGGSYFDPFFGLNAGGFGPYTVFPLFVILPRRYPSSHWPHTTSALGYVGARPVFTPAPIRIPTYTPRPITTATGVRSYRPAAAPAPHPVAPVAIHR